jgi:hypothetical protein
MSHQKTVATDVYGVDSVIGGDMPSALIERLGLHSTANAPGSGFNLSYAIGVTRALLGI